MLVVLSLLLLPLMCWRGSAASSLCPAISHLVHISAVRSRAMPKATIFISLGAGNVFLRNLLVQLTIIINVNSTQLCFGCETYTWTACVCDALAHTAKKTKYTFMLRYSGHGVCVCGEWLDMLQSTHTHMRKRERKRRASAPK